MPHTSAGNGLPLGIKMQPMGGLKVFNAQNIIGACKNGCCFFSCKLRYRLGTSGSIGPTFCQP